MMLDYILRCLILVPLVGGLAWASLSLWHRAGMGSAGSHRKKGEAQVTDIISLGTQGRLVVVHFGKARLLVAATRTQINVIAENALD
jgi:flagellar protein FliO/FliZ